MSPAISQPWFLPRQQELRRRERRDGEAQVTARPACSGCWGRRPDGRPRVAGTRPLLPRGYHGMFLRIQDGKSLGIYFLGDQHPRATMSAACADGVRRRLPAGVPSSAFHRFTETAKRTISLSLRNSGRKTAHAFPGIAPGGGAIINRGQRFGHRPKRKSATAKNRRAGDRRR